MRLQKIRIGALGVMLCLALTSCAMKANTRQNVTIGNVALAQGLFALDDGEMMLFKAGKITAEQHQAFSEKMVPLLEAGRAANQVLMTWPVNQPTPPELQIVINSLKDLGESVIATLPDGEVKSALQQYYLQVQQIVITVLSLLANGGVS